MSNRTSQLEAALELANLGFVEANQAGEANANNAGNFEGLRIALANAIASRGAGRRNSNLQAVGQLGLCIADLAITRVEVERCQSEVDAGAVWRCERIAKDILIALTVGD